MISTSFASRAWLVIVAALPCAAAIAAPQVRTSAGVVQGIEAAAHPFLIGVQWHPEYLIADSRQQALFRTLVATAAGDAAALAPATA